MNPMELEWRMYGLVPYNISPIQQGIQFGHAVVEYGIRMEAHFDSEDYPLVKAYEKWRFEDKTFIILNGGTTNAHRAMHTGIPQGSLNQHCDALQDNDVMIGWFTEPDLGDQLTAVVFLVDERVFDKKNYPDFGTYLKTLKPLEDYREYDMMLKLPFEDRTNFYLESAPEEYLAWEKIIGGRKNVWLREFLSQFRLA